ncbi:hypothetical protein Q4Q34_10950 [Flavivirga abyssicola]|uniref:hypothetical protein n=1 Tax=Flavivirga abyssicola TaxID=3063533 RepID=UPI0026E02494|nr:hypothetical protein [Flavivirga sp. MEBiC07777]WVK11742.1 hypothetical protein Q4Q34_10950 [Flavivirga sp. MEBiC07777]
MNTIKYIIICCLILVSCSNDDDEISTLSAYIEGTTIETGAVIACAASDKDSNDVLTFYYPEPGATNVRFYQTNDANVDHSNFSNYSRVLLNSDPFFNGYLGKFTQTAASTERWIVVTFELEGEIKISNPIRTKQISKPTVWSEDVDINQDESGMPKFTWVDNPVGDNAIYFQVISTAQNELLSGTYTYENYFQYYKTDNVVLNITTETPPVLTLNNTYNFTLMDVSEDNWVNLVISKNFIAQ